MVGKYYTVRVGRIPGIYKSWAECQAQTNGFSGAVFKSFGTEKEANEFAFPNSTSSQSAPSPSQSAPSPSQSAPSPSHPLPLPLVRSLSLSSLPLPLSPLPLPLVPLPLPLSSP